MLIRPHRFHGYNSLRGVYGRGQTVRAALLSLKYFNRGGDRPYRAAVVVSRKVNKSAVVRNRIRRRIYEIIRQQDRQLPPGLDLVFTAFGDELASLEPKRLEGVVAGLLQKAAQATGSQESDGPRDIVKPKGN